MPMHTVLQHKKTAALNETYNNYHFYFQALKNNQALKADVLNVCMLKCFFLFGFMSFSELHALISNEKAIHKSNQESYKVVNKQKTTKNHIATIFTIQKYFSIIAIFRRVFNENCK